MISNRRWKLTFLVVAAAAVILGVLAFNREQQLNVLPTIPHRVVGVASNAASISAVTPPLDDRIESVPLSAASAKSPVIVASWNINFANRDLKLVVQQLLQSNADVVCLQETTPQSEDYLRFKLRARYQHTHALGNEGQWSAERFMILSRTPIQSISQSPPTRNFFGHVVAKVQLHGVPTTIIISHLAPFSSRGARTMSQLLLAMGQSEIDHQHEIDAIVKDVPIDSPSLVVGDLNSLSSFAAPTTLEKNGLIDTFAELHPNPDLDHRTWRWPIGNFGEVDLRIDYIFHSRHFKGAKAAVVESRCSDHRLIVTELLWQTPSGDVADDGTDDASK